MSGNNPAQISEKSMTNVYGQPCWMEESNAHGLAHTPHWFEEDDRPEMDEWVRAPWMDEPGAGS